MSCLIRLCYKDAVLTLLNSLFAPSTADDLKHDEALSSRVAALNLLELSLDHLGVKTREFDPEDPDPEALKRDQLVAKGLEILVEKVGHGECRRPIYNESPSLTLLCHSLAIARSAGKSHS